MVLKPSELRNLTKEELLAKLNSLKGELYNLRYESASGRVEKPHKVKQTRRDIARILTILREKEIGEKGNGAQR